MHSSNNIVEHLSVVVPAEDMITLEKIFYFEKSNTKHAVARGSDTRAQLKKKLRKSFVLLLDSSANSSMDVLWIVKFLYFILFIAIVLYKWITRNYDFFVNRKIPHGAPRFPFGTSQDLIKKKVSIFDYIRGWYEKFPDERCSDEVAGICSFIVRPISFHFSRIRLTFLDVASSTPELSASSS